LPVRMNPRSISIACLVVAAALPLAARPARADAWLLSPGDHYSSIGSSYFSADSYHDLNGTRHPLDQGGLHEEKSLFSYNEFGWTKGRTFILGFPFAGVTRRDGSPAADGGRTETGFGDLLIGLRIHAFGTGATTGSVEIDWNPPMGYNRSLNPRIGEGASNLVGKFAYGMPVGHFAFVSVDGGYRYYMDKTSASIDYLDNNGNRATKTVNVNNHAPTDQVVADATVGWWLSHALLAAGRYQAAFGRSDPTQGLPIIGGDQTYHALPGDAVAATTNAHVTTQMAGPLLVYKTSDRLDLMVGSMHTMTAKNALHVDRLYVAIALKQTKLGRLQGLAGARSSP